MAKHRKPRKRYRGVDSAAPPPTIRIEAAPKSTRQLWWAEHKTTVMIRLAQLAFLLIVYGLVRWVWSLLT